MNGGFCGGHTSHVVSSSEGVVILREFLWKIFLYTEIRLGQACRQYFLETIFIENTLHKKTQATSAAWVFTAVSKVGKKSVDGDANCQGMLVAVIALAATVDDR
ncbi:hypothetical protein [Halomonas sp. BC04]|uniref:hypothetical protein n=1 Tax=Halomonas sp. BC04 TaxID=1403540 RepID=UPI0012DD9FDC|nr:hypothetical protein [Halomonas sp. BC04]